MLRIDIIEKAGKVNREAINAGFEAAQPGVSLKEVDQVIEDKILSNGCRPAFKNYQPHGAPYPFPATACLSVNDAAVHGIPNDYILEAGDVLTIDVGTNKDGWFVDAARTRVIPGAENEEGIRLIEVVEAMLAAQLSVLRPGCRFIDIVDAASNVARANNASIFSEYGGHYIGDAIHIPPFIPNALNTKMSELHQNLQRKQWENMTFKINDLICLEPVATFGSENTIIDKDQWTVRQKNGCLVAHTERCLLVTSDGYQILS